jgi:hypothetical protein
MSELPAWPKDGYPDRATAVAYAQASMTPAASRLYISLDKQRMILARAFLYPHACPNCEAAMAVVDARHVSGDDFVCTNCEAKLVFTVPIVATGPTYWIWQLAPHQIPTPDSQESEKGASHG